MSKPNPAVIATVRSDGSPHTAVTWYLWDNGRVLVNMDEGRRRLEHLRNDPRVSLTVLAADGWHRHVTVEGKAMSLDRDVGFEGIDRMAVHYTGSRFPSRAGGRVNAWIEIASWHAWSGTGPWITPE